MHRLGNDVRVRLLGLLILSTKYGADLEFTTIDRSAYACTNHVPGSYDLTGARADGRVSVFVHH